MDNQNGRWVTIKGARVFVKNGQSIHDALKQHFSTKGMSSKDLQNKSSNNNVLGEYKTLTEKTKSGKIKKTSFLQLPIDEYARLCSAVRTRYADKIPEEGSMFLRKHYYWFKYNKDKCRILCSFRISIDGNEEIISELEEEYYGSTK